MTEISYLDRLISYFGRRQRFSRFTPLPTLIKELGLPREQIGPALRVYAQLGLGQRQNKTKNHRPGFRWFEPEVRMLIGGV